jgi:MurNAc alpha-1-phosphate uridylyltransferase
MRAMILAAGRGERMRPLTDTCPKPLLKVGGKPLIVWHIERLAKAGFRQIVINHAHLGGMLEATLGDGKIWGADIRYSREIDALETAGGIAKALPMLGGSPFLVVNGDIYCELDFKAFAARALDRITQGMHAHLAMVNNPAHHAEGDFALNERGLLARTGEHRLTFAGVGAYRPELFAQIVAGEKAALAPILIIGMENGRVSGEHFAGRWVDVGTPERLAELDAVLKVS